MVQTELADPPVFLYIYHTAPAIVVRFSQTLGKHLLYDNMHNTVEHIF